MTQPIPERFHSLTPCLTVDGGLAALDFYERAFGAAVVRRLVVDGMLLHAELRIGDSILTMSDAMPDHRLVAPEPGKPTPGAIMIYCEDAAALQERAAAAGAKVLHPVSDQFHGDRAGSLRDPFGHRWIVATHTEDMDEAELQRRAEQMMSSAQ